ncbi:MAG TPA: hypothetical protein VF615_12020 [Longimicrobiaceae bacterium]|jgi:hypothetical protein
MRKLLLLLLLSGQFAWAGALNAQVWYRDINCPTRLNDEVNDYQPVTHENGRFWSQWDSEVKSYPLPSKNWYRAYPVSSINSDDNGLRWHNARILVHCYEEKTIYYTRFHYHQIGSAGRVEILQCKADGGVDPFLNEPYSTTYDPYATAGPAGVVASDCSGDGGDTGAGCPSLFVTIEISYDGGSTWEPYWQGWVIFCD